MLAGVAGAADAHRPAVERGVGVGHVVLVGRQPEPGEHLGRTRPLHREHAEAVVLPGDLDAFRCGRREPAHHLSGVRGVRHEEHLVVADEVGDQVVDDTAGLVAAQRVLRLPGFDPPEVVGQARVDERARAGSAHGGLAEVRDVEDAHRLADRRVLLQHAAAARGVFDGHLPAAEVGELRPQVDVAFVQRRSLQTHSRTVSTSRLPGWGPAPGHVRIRSLPCLPSLWSTRPPRSPPTPSSSESCPARTGRAWRRAPNRSMRPSAGGWPRR